MEHTTALQRFQLPAPPPSRSPPQLFIIHRRTRNDAPELVPPVRNIWRRRPIVLSTAARAITLEPHALEALERWPLPEEHSGEVVHCPGVPRVAVRKREVVLRGPPDERLDDGAGGAPAVGVVDHLLLACLAFVGVVLSVTQTKGGGS